LVGSFAGYQNQTSTANTSIGFNAGFYNRTGTDNTVIGHNTNNTIGVNDLSRTVVVGASSSATSDDAIVIGYNAASSTENSIAIGNNTSQSHDSSIIIGHNAVSHAANTVAIGSAATVSWDPSADSVTTLGTNSYRFEDIFSNKISINAASGNAAQIDLFADAASSDNDQWSIKAADAGDFTISSFASGSDVNILTVNNNGNATLSGNLTVNSDRRLKQTIQPIKSALGLLSQIEGVTYFWKPEFKRDDKKQYGLIAQNVEAAIPELIEIGSNDIKSVNYQALIPVLINAVNDQQQQINQQQKHIEQLMKLQSDKPVSQK